MDLYQGWPLTADDVKPSYRAALQSGETESDMDGGGLVVPHRVGAEPIVRTRVPPCAI